MCLKAGVTWNRLTTCSTILQGVVPKPGVHDEQKEKDQVKPSNVINITALFFEKDSSLVTHIYAARQLSFDEAHRKVRRVQYDLNYNSSTTIRQL